MYLTQITNSFDWLVSFYLLQTHIVDSYNVSNIPGLTGVIILWCGMF